MHQSLRESFSRVLVCLRTVVRTETVSETFAKLLEDLSEIARIEADGDDESLEKAFCRRQ